MRPARLLLVCLAPLVGLSASALAQSYFPPRPSDVYGVGCYWFQGHQYCNRYCWREIDGHRYCHDRLRRAGTQAPPPAGIIPPGSPLYQQGPRR
jgi:hypothetical protein